MNAQEGDLVLLISMDRMVAHTGYLVFARKILCELDSDWFTPTRGRDRAAQRGKADDYW